jgi:hypothetical protein
MENSSCGFCQKGAERYNNMSVFLTRFAKLLDEHGVVIVIDEVSGLPCLHDDIDTFYFNKKLDHNSALTMLRFHEQVQENVERS